MSDKFKSIKIFLQACDKSDLNAKEVCNWALTNNIPFVWHPLGFVMATIINEGNEKIRLHLWSNSFQNAQKPTWLIHDHLFDLTSWVLSGEIENTEFKQGNNSLTHRHYSVSYDKDGSILTKLDSGLSLSVERKDIMKKNESYAIKSGILHQSISTSKNTTVTVCHTVDVRDESPLVAGDLYGDFKYQYKRKTVTPSDLSKIVAEI